MRKRSVRRSQRGSAVQTEPLTIDNSCLGPTELAFVTKFAAEFTGRLPRMPMPMRKMGLDRRLIVRWVEVNAEYRASVLDSLLQVMRRVGSQAERKESRDRIYRDHPFFLTLDVLAMDCGDWARISYRRRVRSATYPVGGTYTQDDIERLRRRQKNRCRYFRFCGTIFETEPFQVDHRVAVSVGGDNTIDNLQLVCRSCNSRKYNMGHAAFVRKMEAERGGSSPEAEKT